MMKTTSVSHYFIFSKDNDCLRLTQIGIDRFKNGFAEIGVNVRSIETLREFQSAHALYLANEIRKSIQTTADPELKSLLDAFFNV